MSEQFIPNIAIMASGEGSTADAYAQAIKEDQVTANLSLLISTAFDAPVLDKVDRWNDDYNFDTEKVVINGETHPEGKMGRGQTYSESEAVANLLDRRGIDLLVLMGCLRILKGPLIDRRGYLPGIHKSK